jgi:DNA-nicking Smr family endonuclease
LVKGYAMDFGDILNEWERKAAASPGKKQNPARLPVPAEDEKTGLARGEGLKKVDPLTAWLRLNPVYDKDAEIEKAESSAAVRRRRLLARRPDAVLDLHGLTRDEAWNTLETFFQDSRRKGFEKVLIVHGKGNHSDGEGVLKNICRTFIERCPFAGESGHGRAANGASGATWVILRGGKR